MSSKSVQTIGYDIRAVWRRDLDRIVRRLSRADLPGLENTRRLRPVRHLVDAAWPPPVDDQAHRSWAIDVGSRSVGAVAATVSEYGSAETPLPWSETSPKALEVRDRPALLIDSVFWESGLELDPGEVLRDTICNTVHLESFCEARVELPFRPNTYGPSDWLMMLYSAFRHDRWTETPIAVFLRAGFDVQGWYDDGDGGPVARLNWSNRAR